MDQIIYFTVFLPGEGGGGNGPHASMFHTLHLRLIMKIAWFVKKCQKGHIQISFLSHLFPIAEDPKIKLLD